MRNRALPDFLSNDFGKAFAVFRFVQIGVKDHRDVADEQAAERAHLEAIAVDGDEVVSGKRLQRLPFAREVF